MLDMGFIHDVKKLIAMLPERRQTLFFSATMPPEIVKLSDSILHNPARVTVTPVSSSAYPTKAIRPKNSRLSKDCLDAAGFQRLPRWQDAVGRYLIELCAN